MTGENQEGQTSENQSQESQQQGSEQESGQEGQGQEQEKQEEQKEKQEGLFGQARTEEVEKKIDETTPKWWIDKDKPGEGERPAHLKEKFKTQADQAKAYPELEKKFGSFEGAPEEYSTEIDGYKVDTDSPVLKDFKVFAKAENMNQDIFTKCLKLYGESTEPETVDLTKEVERFGNSEKLEKLRITAEERLRPDQLKVLNSVANNAIVWDALSSLINESKNIASVQNQQAHYRSTTKTDIDKEVIANYEQYKNDPEYRKQIQEKISSLAVFEKTNS